MSSYFIQRIYRNTDNPEEVRRVAWKCCVGDGKLGSGTALDLGSNQNMVMGFFNFVIHLLQHVLKQEPLLVKNFMLCIFCGKASTSRR